MSKGRNQRKVTDYSGLSDTKHALTRADTYIGSTVRSQREVMVMNIEKMLRIRDLKYRQNLKKLE